MLKKPRKVNILEKREINYAELDKELKVELAILGGLDIFTNAHVVGVAQNTQKICDALDLDYKTTKHCILAAYMHDIGKIKVPSEILQKPGKLTDEEFQIIKMHTVYGYEIVMRYDQFKYLAPVVRGHHENLDGSGYPDGLKDEQITEEAKLIKVADVWDALTKRRQYKEGFKSSKAAEIMLDDVKKGKMGSKYLYYLLCVVIDELIIKNNGDMKELKKAKEDLITLKDLDVLYKQIYDRGYKTKYANKLKRYELSPGYDMTTNTNLLTRTNAKIENLEKIIKENKSELSKLRKECKEARRRIKFKERRTYLFGKRV